MKNKSLLITLSLMGAIYVFTLSNLNFGKDHWKSILESDARAYYAYLPAFFIYHDLNFGFFDKVEASDECVSKFRYEYRVNRYGKDVNKYFAGTAVAQMPFFLFGHLMAKMTHAPVTGYSKPYIMSVSLGAVIYTISGLLLMYFICGYYTTNVLMRIFIVSTTGLGTQLFYYTVCEPGMSHIYSFFYVNVFIFGLLRTIKDYNRNSLILSSFALGMLILIRPVNAMTVLITPFLCGSYSDFIAFLRFIKNNAIHLLLSVLTVILLSSVQLIIYFKQTGHFFIDSYGQEGFNFANPYLLSILFSFKKGLFVYTPLLLLFTAGLAGYFKGGKWKVLTWTGAFLILTYVLSSWWCWYYGGSFGLRAYIEYYAFFAILFADGANQLFLRHTKVLIFTGVLLILVCQYQTLLYRKGVIHWSEMNAEKYFKSWLYPFSKST